MEYNLRVPGPTPISPEVREALSRQMINHRGPEFRAMQNGLVAHLQEFYQTTNEVLIFPSSGTGGMEAAVVNVFSPGDEALAVSIGVFGDRFAKIAKIFGVNVTKVDFPWGQPADPEVIARELDAHPGVRAVLVTHNETSTGVTNDLAAIARVVKERERLLVVDGISSVAAIDLPVDQLGCDVVVSGSQKAWAIPPGMAFISVSPRAWEYNARATTPRMYWDFAAMRASMAKGETPYTPAVSLYYALEASFRQMTAEGVANVFARHQRLADTVRGAVKDLGLELFARPSHASNTVTAIKVPEGIDGKALVRTLRENYGVVIAGGQSALEGKILRMGHMGFVTEAELLSAVDALRQALAEAGFAGAAQPARAAGAE